MEYMREQNDMIKEIRKFKQLDYQEDDEDRLRREYMYYHPNREYSG
eukprot:CAMPEP_0116886774 /NCGR_PEP_ID=MMETSP0463-20121206/20731_1 /TAXON_ID=181622 /ORGANISM="Strombidinopsis sp, Strain SopsisLIS2011" /LENGTH=45 /DNA_ID= /DNA_START= /DNA_END= /DNA_ORIENTATION=